jgi:hypothetical protein
MSSSRIEGLPDDVEETNDAVPRAAGPEPPPAENKNVDLDELYEKRLNAPNAISDKSFEEVLFDMSKTPIFMNEADLANQSESSSHPFLASAEGAVLTIACS